MTNPTDDELNRKCAERLGYQHVGERWHDVACQQGKGNCRGKLPDFLRDPVANEMLLEAMELVTLIHWSTESGTSWQCHAFDCESAWNPDRKRAIVLAFLDMLTPSESSKEK